PAAGNQPTVNRSLRDLGVHVERLCIEATGKVDHLLFVNRLLAQLVNLPLAEVFPISHSSNMLRCRIRAPVLLTAALRDLVEWIKTCVPPRTHLPRKPLNTSLPIVVAACLAVVAAFSCARDAKPDSLRQANAPASTGIDLDGRDRSIAPGTDFFL